MGKLSEEAKQHAEAERIARDERERARVLDALKNKLALTERKLAQSERDLDDLRELQRYFEDSPEPEPVQMEHRKRKTTGTATAIIALNDWHFEERVDPATVNNFNEHNPEIASRKIKNTFERAVELIEAERGMSKIDDMVVALLGDFITGYIHPELEESNYMSPTEAMLEVENHIAGGIDFLLKHSGCKHITVPAVCGNHGRTTQKQRIATSYAIAKRT